MLYLEPVKQNYHYFNWLARKIISKIFEFLVVVFRYNLLLFDAINLKIMQEEKYFLAIYRIFFDTIVEPKELLKIASSFKFDEVFNDMPIESVPLGFHQLICINQNERLPEDVIKVDTKNLDFFVYPFSKK